MRSVQVLVIRATDFNPRITGGARFRDILEVSVRKSVPLFVGEASQIARRNERVDAEKCAAGEEVTQTPLMTCPVIPSRHSRLTPFLRCCQGTW